MTSSFRKVASLNSRKKQENVNESGQTPLHDAARSKDTVPWLLFNSADVKEVDKDGRTPLHNAAQASSKYTVGQLLNKGADVKAVDKDSRTPLHDAAQAGSEDTVPWLLDGGDADVEAVDKDGRTPLHDAAQAGSNYTVSHLVNRGADVEAANKDGRTPLHDAARAGSEYTVRWLVDIGGADVKAVDKDGRTPLHDAARAGSGATAGWLVDRGADVKAVDKDGRTPLHSAAQAGSEDTILWLVDIGGADVKAVDKDGRTPLHDAARAGSEDTVGQLLNFGADVKAADKNGRTPLHDAVWSNVAETVCVLIQRIADTQYLDQLELLPRQFVSEYTPIVSADAISPAIIAPIVQLWAFPWDGLATYEVCDGDISNVLTVSRIEPQSHRFIARTVSEYLAEVHPTFGSDLLEWVYRICKTAKDAIHSSLEMLRAQSSRLKLPPHRELNDPLAARPNPSSASQDDVVITGLLDARNLAVVLSANPETSIQDVKAAVVWVLAALRRSKNEEGIFHLPLNQDSLDKGIPSPTAFKPQVSDRYCWLKLFSHIIVMDITLPIKIPIDPTPEGLEIMSDVLIEFAQVDREAKIFGKFPILYGFDTALVPLQSANAKERRLHFFVTEGRQITPRRAEQELLKLRLDDKLLETSIGHSKVYVGWCPNFAVDIYSKTMKACDGCATKPSGVPPSGRVEEQSERSSGKDISFPCRIGFLGSSFSISPGAKLENKFKTVGTIAPRNREANFERVLSSASNIPSILWGNNEEMAWLFPVISVLAFASLRYIESMRYTFRTQQNEKTEIHYSTYSSMAEKNTAEEAETVLRENGPFVVDTAKGFPVTEPMTFENLVREIWEKMCDGEDLCIDDTTGLNREDSQGIFGYDLSEATSGTRPQLRKLHCLPEMKKWSLLLQVRRVQIIFSHHVGSSLRCCCDSSGQQPTRKGTLTCLLADLRNFYGENWEAVATDSGSTGLPIGEKFQ